MVQDSGQAGATGRSTVQVTPEMIARVLSILRASGIADHVSELDAPLAGRICRSVLGVARELCETAEVLIDEGEGVKPVCDLFR